LVVEGKKFSSLSEQRARRLSFFFFEEKTERDVALSSLLFHSLARACVPSFPALVEREQRTRLLVRVRSEEDRRQGRERWLQVREEKSDQRSF